MPDTPAEGVQGDGTGGDPSDEFFTVKVPKGTYRDEESASKGYAEAQKTISRLQSERDKAKSDGAKLNDILEKLTESVTAKPAEPKEDTQVPIEVFVEKAASAMEDDPKQGIRMILEAVSGWTAQSEKAQATARETAIKEIATQLGQSVAEVKRTLAERDPDVLTYGDAARKLAETSGIDFDANRETLLAIAKATAKPDHPSRHDLPGGSSTTRVMGREAPEPLSDAQKKLIGWDQLTDSQRSELKRKWEADNG